MISASPISLSLLRCRPSPQLTDCYLLALAAAKGGRFATFDRNIHASSVKGGKDALLVLGSED